MISIINLVNTIISYRYKSKTRKKCCCFFMLRTLRFHSFNNFHGYHTAVSVTLCTVTMLDLTSLMLILQLEVIPFDHLPPTELLIFLPHICSFSSLPCLSQCNSILRITQDKRLRVILNSALSLTHTPNPLVNPLGFSFKNLPRLRPVLITSLWRLKPPLYFRLL